MAEGFLRHFGKNQFEVFSAGTRPGRVNSIAIEVMKELGIDISHHHSKHVDEFKKQHFDLVITVCDDAKESCPAFSGAAAQIHWGFPDPPHSQKATKEVIDEFRRVRDMILFKFKGFTESELE
jgi:arsenate reductase